MHQIVRRITVIDAQPKGTTTSVIFDRDKGKSRKSSRILRPVEKMQRRALKVQKTFADEALAQHEKYAHKRKDGWLINAPLIVLKANRKALKKYTS